MRMPFQIPYLELLITHQCNLHCDGCANYSNYGLKNEMKFEENREYLRLWSRRISPDTLRILGGEPTIHKNLIDYVNLMHFLWPSAERHLVTNGAFLHRHKELPELLRATGTSLHLSFHSSDPKYLEWIRPIFAHLKTFEGVNISYSDYRKFKRLHRGVGASMLPYEDNDPVQSWLHCPANQCKTIWGGRLWKCGPIMGLRSVLNRFGLEDSPDWARYLAYEGLGLDASEEELHRFLAQGPENICNMCPKEPQPYKKDIYNVNWQRNVEKVEWEGDEVEIQKFIDSIKAVRMGDV